MRKTPTNSIAKTWLWLAIGVAACAVSWAYMHRVLLPWEYYGNVTHGRLKAQMGDLYPRWVGTRELLLNGKNPYSTEVSHEIQMAFYGHAIEQTYDKPDSEIVDEQRFAYPVYIVFLLAPTVHADFGQLQAWAPVVLAAFVAVSIWLWMDVLQWRPPLVFVCAVVLFALSSPQVAQGLRLRQFGLFVGFLLALASWCVNHKRYWIAGILLAISTIKPQMVLLCLVWFLIWTLGRWKDRWPLAAGFGGALCVLVSAGELLVRGWPTYFLEALTAYQKYFRTTSPLRLLLGNWLGGGLSVLAVTVLLAFSWDKRHASANSPDFVHLLALFFVATTLVLPLLTPYNHVLLLLPLLALVKEWGCLPRWARYGFYLLMAWPIATASVMLLRPPQVESMHWTPLLPSALVLLFPFFALWFMLAPKRAQAF